MEVIVTTLNTADNGTVTEIIGDTCSNTKCRTAITIPWNSRDELRDTDSWTVIDTKNTKNFRGISVKCPGQPQTTEFTWRNSVLGFRDNSRQAIAGREYADNRKQCDW